MQRKLSLILAFIAIVVIPVFAIVRGQFEVAAMRAERDYVCGMPILALYLLALMLSGLLSAVALAFGGLAYRSLPSPRPPSRTLELIVIAAPFLLAALVWLFVLFAG